MHRALSIVLALSLFATTNVCRADEYVMQFKPGGPFGVGIGGELIVIKKQRPLPNVFGSADIFGRKVDTGSIVLQFMGAQPDGKAKIRRTDIDITSTASTMSRSPGFATGSSSADGSFNRNGGQFSGNSQQFGMSPTGETNMMLPPRLTDFAIGPGETYPLPSGHYILVQGVAGQQLGYFIKAGKAGKASGGYLPPPERN